MSTRESFSVFFRQNDTYYNKAKKCSRQKTIESIGWLNELEKQYDDPIAHFQKRVEQLKADKSRQYCLICPLSSRQVKYLKVSDKNTYISFWSVGIFMHTISLYIF